MSDNLLLCFKISCITALAHYSNYIWSRNGDHIISCSFKICLANLKETEHIGQHDIYHGEIRQQSGSRGWRADGTIDRREEKDGGTAPSDVAKVCMDAGKHVA